MHAMAVAPQLPKPKASFFKRWACLALLLVFVSGCGFRFAYNNLDWLLPWYIKSFVTLTEGQKDYLSAKLPGHLDWHRQTQLKEYVVWLDRWADHINYGVKRQQLEQTNRQMQSLFVALLQQTLPDVIYLMASATDSQIEEIIRKLEKDNQAFAENINKVSSEGYRKQQAESSQKTLQVWLGPLTKSQERHLALWSQRFVSVGEKTVLYRAVWLERFKEIVTDRHRGEGFRLALEQLIVNPEQDWDALYLEHLEQNKDITNTLWLDVLGSLTEKQKRHALAKIRSWQGDIEKLITLSG